MNWVVKIFKWFSIGLLGLIALTLVGGRIYQVTSEPDLPLIVLTRGVSDSSQQESDARNQLQQGLRCPLVRVFLPRARPAKSWIPRLAPTPLQSLFPGD
jgi:L-arabinose isomerase